MVVTFLQWNILYTEKPSNIIKLLKRHNPDIFALQEITAGFSIHNKQNVAELIADELGYEYHAELTPSASASTNQVKELFGSGIFTRFPLVARDLKWIAKHDSSIPSGYDNESKAYIELTTTINGKELTIGTTHMSYTDRFTNNPRKQQEADNLLEILKTKKNTYIFSGDLNSEPNSYTIKNIQKHLLHAGPDLSAKTWTTKPFKYQGFEETELNWRLDYVFATSDIKLLSAEIVSTDYSDHLPILVTLDF